MINIFYFWLYFVRLLVDVLSIFKCLCDELRFRLGELLLFDIILLVIDKYGNKIGKVRRFV